MQALSQLSYGPDLESLPRWERARPAMPVL
jgi:hypothetical protein